MDRIAEPELMQEPKQVEAYAMADFAEPHEQFVDLLVQSFEEFSDAPNYKGTVLDLGCGAGDISRRFAQKCPKAYVHGVDGSAEMLNWADKLSTEQNLDQRLVWIHGYLGQIQCPRARYDAIISNSLLHHLRDPQDLWLAIQHRAAPGAPVFIMDLFRPHSPSQARDLVQQYAKDEPEVLQNDFYHSLLAAYTYEEIQQQLQIAQLPHFSIEQCSDRHMCIKGRMSTE